MTLIIRIGSGQSFMNGGCRLRLFLAGLSSKLWRVILTKKLSDQMRWLHRATINSYDYSDSDCL